MAGGPGQPRVVRWPAAVAGTPGIRLKTHLLKEVCVAVVMMCGE